MQVAIQVAGAMYCFIHCTEPGVRSQSRPCGICCGQYGSGTGLLWTVWQRDRFVVESMVVGQVCCGQYGSGTGLLWTVWQWERFVVDSMAVGKVCCGQYGSGTGLLWTVW